MWVNGLKTILSIAGKIKTEKDKGECDSKKEGEWEYRKWLYNDFKLSFVTFFFFYFYLRHFTDYYISQQ